jgi:hypothetical protein
MSESEMAWKTAARMAAIAEEDDDEVREYYIRMRDGQIRSIPTGHGPGCVTEVEECRRRARACLGAARATPVEEMRATLIDAAQTWLRLAEEQNDAAKEPQVR